ncbi:hypothetical protein [Robbsia andropogonis]|uniref:hypothetical protein n=1 Tax=Robbsia andropogonis TaxID=28092 RepID=UPI001FC85C1C|nr:hypothetical protein [Robbsia andropogonis]
MTNRTDTYTPTMNRFEPKERASCLPDVTQSFPQSVVNAVDSFSRSVQAWNDLDFTSSDTVEIQEVTRAKEAAERALYDAIASHVERSLSQACARPWMHIIKHTDDEAVDQFAWIMRTKMAVSRAKGRSGWDDPAQCSVEHLALMLIEHFHKGDLVDIANLCMMLHWREMPNATLQRAMRHYDSTPF